MNASGHEKDILKQKLYIRLPSGKVISVWKCLILEDSEDVSYENSRKNFSSGDKREIVEDTLIRRLNCFVREPRDRTRFRIVLLTCGGHFAGCVFDGNAVVAHKTFHR